MPTEQEKQVLNLLSMVDFAPGTDPGKLIESWGNDAVTVACEAALGSYPGLQRKVRNNAVAVLQTIDTPQAKETVRMLVKDSDPDVSIRALRAAAGQKSPDIVSDLTKMLNTPALTPLVAVEVVKALQGIDSGPARDALAAYRKLDSTKLPHRGNALVKAYIEKS
jgi:HEAT repeat protein